MNAVFQQFFTYQDAILSELKALNTGSDNSLAELKLIKSRLMDMGNQLSSIYHSMPTTVSNLLPLGMAALVKTV